MPTILIGERVKLNYSICTIASIIVYTFSVAAFAAEFSKLILHTFYFIVAEIMKLMIIQKMYSLDVTNNQEGFKKRRPNRVGESVKFAVLMMLTVLSFVFICIIMGGKLDSRVPIQTTELLNPFQHRLWRTTRRPSRSPLSSPH